MAFVSKISTRRMRYCHAFTSSGNGWKLCLENRLFKNVFHGKLISKINIFLKIAFSRVRTWLSQSVRLPKKLANLQKKRTV